MPYYSKPLIIILCLQLTSCFNIAGDCNTEVLARICNNQKTFVAVKSQIDCGATTTPGRNIIIMEGCDNDVKPLVDNIVFGSDQVSDPIDFKWKNENTLIIYSKYKTQAVVAKSQLILKKSNKSILIEYKKNEQ